MSDYTKIVDYAAKDALLTGNPAKLVKGTEIGAEFDAIVTAVATKVDETGGAATNLTLTTPILGTPQSGTVTNLTGTASININGTVGATTPAAGAFTTLSATTPLPITSGGTGANSDATARSALSAAASGANSDITSLIGITGPINEARGSIAMHATTMDLWAQPNIIDGTSSAVTITAIANAPQAGARRVLYPVAASVITNGATFAVDGAANATAAAGDAWEFEAITTSTYKVHITKKDGTAVVSGETAWTDYSATSTIVGWSSYTTKSIYYKDIGKTRFVTFMLYGTSNSTSASFTLPSASSNTVGTNVGIRVIDNSVEGAVGIIGLLANSSTVTCYKSLLAAWTSSGDKLVSGQFFYDLP